jgi:GNAT superfamily N-acetyltransferase
MNQEVRIATVADDIAICEVLRRSISECCFADHHGDPNVISAWLENKTKENVVTWIQSPNSIAVVAIQEGGLVGFALATGDELALCYVVPEALHQGVGRQLLSAIEVRSIARGTAILRLESTSTALQFYLRNGFVPSGPAQLWAGMTGQPMVKHLTANLAFNPIHSGWSLQR